jgi:hypothetical protein
MVVSRTDVVFIGSHSISPAPGDYCLLILSCSRSADEQSAGDFENWYFDFLQSELDYVGKYFTPDGREFGNSRGTAMGSITSDEHLFTETVSNHYETLYEPQNNTIEITIKWRKSGDFSQGQYQDSNGLEVAIIMNVSENHQFSTESSAPDGRTMTTEGQLMDDGTVSVNETMRDPSGNVILTSKIVMSKTP